MARNRGTVGKKRPFVKAVCLQSRIGLIWLIANGLVEYIALKGWRGHNFPFFSYFMEIEMNKGVQGIGIFILSGIKALPVGYFAGKKGAESVQPLASIQVTVDPKRLVDMGDVRPGEFEKNAKLQREALTPKGP